MSWITDVQTVANTAKAGITAVSNDIQNTFSINANKTIDMIDSFFTNGYSIVGINANLIETVMYPAIDRYVDAINKQLDRLVNYEPEVAFKGTEIVGALKEYIDAVKILCSNIVSHMLAFREELAAVKKDGKWGYVDKDGNLVIDFQYDFASDFRFDIAEVRVGKERFFIDKSGQVYDIKG